MVKKPGTYPLTSSELGELAAAFRDYCARCGVLVSADYRETLGRIVRKDGAGPLTGVPYALADLRHKWEQVRAAEATDDDLVELLQLGAPLVRYVGVIPLASDPVVFRHDYQREYLLDVAEKQGRVTLLCASFQPQLFIANYQADALKNKPPVRKVAPRRNDVKKPPVQDVRRRRKT